MNYTDKRTKDKVMAVVGLVLNVLVLPGLGSIVGSKIRTGIIQLILLGVSFLLFLIGIPLSFILIGIPVLIAALLLLITAWVWGLITGIQMVAESDSRK